jgi:hypothetical protein
MTRLRGFPPFVTRGLDPRVHLFAKKMDRRIKSGDDEETDSNVRQRIFFVIVRLDRTIQSSLARITGCPPAPA